MLIRSIKGNEIPQIPKSLLILDILNSGKLTVKITLKTKTKPPTKCLTLTLTLS